MPPARGESQYGRRGNMSKWVSDLRADCPKRNATHLHERCDLICPDLPKVACASGAHVFLTPKEYTRCRNSATLDCDAGQA